jgi:hypothetical protein
VTVTTHSGVVWPRTWGDGGQVREETSFDGDADRGTPGTTMLARK